MTWQQLKVKDRDDLQQALRLGLALSEEYLA